MSQHTPVVVIVGGGFGGLATARSLKKVVGGDRGAAARLGLKRTALTYRMQKLGISRPQHDPE
jgi:hypothetical protein